MEGKREKKLSTTQKQTLISFMSSNKAFAQNKPGVHAKIKYQLWKELTGILNKQGPYKTIQKWQRVWTDLKNKAKRKALAGPQPQTKPTVQDIEEDILFATLAKLTPEAKHCQRLPDPLPEPPQPSIKEEVASSWSQHESEESWHQEDTQTEPPQLFNVELKPEYSEPENECTWDDPADAWKQENAPSEVNEVENPVEDAELNIQETNTNVSGVEQELSSLNSKVDKFIDQNNVTNDLLGKFIEENKVTNVLLGRIAVALEQFTKK